MGAYLLSAFGYEMTASQQELEDFGVDVAQGALDTGQLVRWFEDHPGLPKRIGKGLCAT